MAKTTKSNPHRGSSFDDFLKEDGIYEEVQARALKRALSEQLDDAMQSSNINKVNMAQHNEHLPKLQEFILPAGNRAASLAHVCRTVARRAERAVVALGNEEALKEAPRQYLNRLSDLMFVLARVLNRYRTDGTVGDDVYWKSERLARGEQGV